MRVLYHFPRSPYSRRVRLVLAHKGLDAELRDARAVPENRVASNARFPGKTVPVLVDDGQAVGDSTAICMYLDRVHPSPALWPGEKVDATRAFRIAALADQALDTLIDFGTRTYALADSKSWGEVKKERIDRAQGCLDALATEAARAPGATLFAGGWCGADIWLFTAVDWLATLPARAGESAHIDQLLSLGWKLPEELAHWASSQRSRTEVRALG